MDHHPAPTAPVSVKYKQAIAHLVAIVASLVSFISAAEADGEHCTGDNIGPLVCSILAMIASAGVLYVMRVDGPQTDQIIKGCHAAALLLWTVAVSIGTQASGCFVGLSNGWLSLWTGFFAILYAVAIETPQARSFQEREKPKQILSLLVAGSAIVIAVAIDENVSSEERSTGVTIVMASLALVASLALMLLPTSTAHTIAPYLSGGLCIMWIVALSVESNYQNIATSTLNMFVWCWINLIASFVFLWETLPLFRESLTAWLGVYALDESLPDGDYYPEGEQSLYNDNNHFGDDYQAPARDNDNISEASEGVLVQPPSPQV